MLETCLTYKMEEVRYAVHAYMTKPKVCTAIEWCANFILAALTFLLLYPSQENFLAFLDFSNSSSVASNFIPTDNLIISNNFNLDSSQNISFHAIKDIIKLLLWDKAQHLASFGGCFAIFTLSRMHHYISLRPLRLSPESYFTYVLKRAALFIVYACVTELLQRYVPNRSFSWLDMTANVLGVLIGLGSVFGITKIVAYATKDSPY